MAFSLKDKTGQSYTIGSILHIGRDLSNGIVLPDEQVSRVHATLSEVQGNLLLRDENSTNGTFVNQGQVKGLVQLRIGDSITIGKSTFVVENIPLAPISNPPQFQSIPPQPLNLEKPKKKGIIWPLYFILLIVVLCALPPILGSIYYKAPQSTKNRLLNQFGMGPSTVKVENFGDNDAFIFTTTYLERTVGDDTTPIFNWQIPSFGYEDKDDLGYGVYRLDFGTTTGGNDLGTCIFNIKGGETYDFTILPDSILISRTEYGSKKAETPKSADDFDIATSSLCKYSS